MRAALVPRGVSVRRLRLCGDRMHATRVLESADAFPRGLAASAILCVRSVRARLPHGASSTWSKALSESLDRTAQHAVRPMRESVPASTEAVLFADEAELLACLARDALRGTLADAWWWRSLGLDLEYLPSLWISAAEYVPAALAHLAATGNAVAVVHALPLETVSGITRHVVRQFGLTEIALLLDVESARRVVLSGEVQPSATAAITVSAELSARPPSPRVPPPWQAAAPEATSPGLDPPRQFLLGLALMLQRSPSRARSEAFAAALREWFAAGAAAEHPNPIPTAGEGPSPDIVPGATASPPPPNALAADAVVAERTPLAIRENEPLLPVIAAPDAIQPTRAPAPARDASPATAARELSLTARIPAIDAVERVSIETAVGGIFFLINFALELEWYADFTQPATPGLPLRIWDFLRLAGRGLVGRRAQDDPLWTTLKELSGDPLEVHDAWARWLRWRMPFIRAELRRRLRSRDIGRLVCLHHAVLDLTATHLDVRMSLKDHPIALRLAGLDRDPGWVPAAGRFITFQFELT